jgi:hypothetical protein
MYSLLAEKKLHLLDQIHCAADFVNLPPIGAAK